MVLRQIGWIIFLHFFGDYVLQSSYLAQEKKRNWYLMGVHCLLYAFPFWMLFHVWIVGFIFISHYLIDTLKARYQKINELQDQSLHFLVLGIACILQIQIFAR